MQNSQNKKTLQIVLIVLVAVLTLGIGYKPRKLQGTFHTGTKYYWFNRSKWNIKYRYTG